jgi:hypothetical protein
VSFVRATTALLICLVVTSFSAAQTPPDAAPGSRSGQAKPEQPGSGPAPDQTKPQQPPPLNPTQEIAGEEPEGNALALGPAQLRISGYVGLTGIYRSTNSGGGPGTAFGGIPFEDTVAGNVSETRLSAQASRLSIRVDARFRPEDGPRFRRLSGYFEMDFNGSTPGTVAVTSTSVGFRLRHAFAEVQYRAAFFLAAGQAFTLMTPLKNQLSIWPSDVEMSQAVDTNYLAGMVWERVPQLRLAWRPSTRFNWAVSVENPEQQIGNGIALPVCCAGDLELQYNTGNAELGVPNLMPDFVTRIAVNPNRVLHLDVGGVVRVFRHTIAPYEESFREVGGGAGVNAAVSPTRTTRLILQTAFGSGLGRYVGGLVPDLAFRRDGSISLIGTSSWVGGIEQRISSRASVAGYYSGVDTDDTFELDTDGRYIGFGFPGAPRSNNRTIKEWTTTFSYLPARTENRGSVQFALQASWLERTPWSPGNGPDSANAFMFFAQLRYNLP